MVTPLPVPPGWLFGCEVGQCGYCKSGQIIVAAALLQKNPSPSEQDIRQALNGNLCRCRTYNRIVQAVQIAAGRMSGGSA